MMKMCRDARRTGIILSVLFAASLVSVPASAAPAGFVAADGERLTIDGAPWKAIGVNLWDMDAGRVLAGDLTGCWYQHADLDDYLDRSFAGIKANTGATVVRTFGFRAMYTDGGRDWSTTDKLVHYARKHGLRLIPVFGDQYGTCGSPAKDATWYRGGFRTVVEQPWGIDYRSYVVAAVARYRAEPAIAFWQLMNEATAGTDGGALLSFSRDMVTAIRTDAGDTNHLINLGTAGGTTPGNELPLYGQLLDCATGGCNDLAEAHVFNASQPLPGLPMSSGVTATIRLWNGLGESHTASVARPPIGGYARMTVNVPTPPSTQPFSHWSVTLASPQSTAWNATLDDALVQTNSAPQAYTFETGTDGFTAAGATLSRTTQDPRSGLGALRAAVPAGGGPATLTAPPIAGRATTIELHARVGFRTARDESGASIAADLHSASVTRNKPFVLGEIGYQAQTPGLDRCNVHRSRADRATELQRMLDLVLDPTYGADGAIVWDWKDPAIRSSLPNGTLVNDRMVDCWTVTPGDPAEAIVKTAAASIPAAPLPPPSPLPAFGARAMVYTGPPAEVGFGGSVPIVVRLTRGGDAIAGARLTMRGGCWADNVVTDGLGLASFTCEPYELGPQTFTISVDPASCACQIAPVGLPSVVKRSVIPTGTADVGERGAPVTLRLGLSDPDGASLQGVGWRVPECGLSGTVADDAPTVAFTATCQPGIKDWDGTTALTVVVDGDDATTPASTAFVALKFQRIYFDASARECVGLSPSTGWAGATARPGACSGGGGGAWGRDWFAHQLTGGARTDAFREAGQFSIVDIDAKDGRRIEGVFQAHGNGRLFGGAIIRPSGVHPVWSL